MTGRTDRERAWLMLARAGDMEEIIQLRPAEYSKDDRLGRFARGALRSHVYEFCDAVNELGGTFKNANPRLPFERAEEMRYTLAHEYPSVTPEDVLHFAQEVVPRFVRPLRRARFPQDA